MQKALHGHVIRPNTLRSADPICIRFAGSRTELPKIDAYQLDRISWGVRSRLEQVGAAQATS